MVDLVFPLGSKSKSKSDSVGDRKWKAPPPPARFRIVSRRLVRPEPAVGSPDDDDSAPPPEPETMHLTPWYLRMISVDYIQKGLLLPKPKPRTAAAGGGAQQLVDSLASSLARALARFYPLAGRLAVTDDATTTTTGGPGLVVSLRCNGEGAEFVHAEAPGVTVSDIIAPPGPGVYYIPSSLVWSFFPLNGLLGADAALDEDVPVLAAQVTKLADGVFVAMSLNHAVADGTAFWHLFNTWSEISRRTSDDGGGFELCTPLPVLGRWFLETSPVPIPLPFAKLQDIVRRPEYLPVRECFFHFSAESVKTLKEKANAEMAGTATATVSSLQSLLAHLWRAACRARELPPDRETAYTVIVGCRGRVKCIPPTYVGNTVTFAVARSTVGELLSNGLGWTAWLMNRAVASFDEPSVREDLASWPRDPRFLYVPPPTEDPATISTGSSPRFDAYGNDFGWGRPVAVRSGAGNKMDGKVTVYEGRGGGGSMALEVCLAPKALARLVADEEFMEAVSTAEA